MRVLNEETDFGFLVEDAQVQSPKRLISRPKAPKIVIIERNPDHLSLSNFQGPLKEVKSKKSFNEKARKRKKGRKQRTSFSG